MIGGGKRGPRTLTTPRRALTPLLLLLAAGCHGGGKTASAPTTVTASPSTTAAVQASGVRTVLSPIGVNVRAQPSTTASVLGTAAQGATLTVLAHPPGWYQVRGATVTGYVKDDPSLTGAGKFAAYSDSQGSFVALYPAGWSATPAPPASVVLRPPSGHDSIVITTGSAPSQLGQVQLAYHQESSTVAVVCGFTGQLVTYSALGGSTSVTAAAAAGVVGEQYLVQIDLTLDPHHALGLDANLASLAQLSAVEAVINSLSFPFPQCQGGSTSPTSTSPPATT